MYSVDTILLHFLGFVFGIVAVLAILGAIATLAWEGFKKNRSRAQERRRTTLQRAHNEREGYQSFRFRLGDLKLSPAPFKSDHYFLIEIVGAITCPERLYNSRQARADYYMDRFIDAHVWGKEGASPGAWTPHNNLFFDSSASPALPFMSERHLHRYSFAYRGTGAPLAIYLEASKSMRSWNLSSGSLLVFTSPLSDEDRVLADQHAAEAAKVKPAKPKATRTKKNSRVAHPKADDSQVEAEADGQQARTTFDERLRKLSLEFANPNYSDDEWIKKHARKYATDLLQRKSKIESAYIAFHKDSTFIQYIKDEAPEVYKRTIWQFLALTEAERVDVEPPGRRVPTPEQVRSRMLSKIDIKAKDRMERVKLITTKASEYRHDLEVLGMDEDEIDAQVTTFVEILTAEFEEPDHPVSGNAF
jgi:hypothetical protein